MIQTNEIKKLNMQDLINTLLPQSSKIIATNGEDYLVELEDTRHIIYNNKQFYSTLMRDSGVQFYFTGYQKNNLLTEKDLIKIKPEYEHYSLKMRLMEVLKLPGLIGWEILDTVGNLCLVHYTEDADMRVYGHLRGVVVDVKNGIVVASSYGYTSTTVADEIKFDPQLILKDNDDYVHRFNVENTVIKKVYEGTVMRVIYYEGQVYRIIHKKIRPLKSRWVNTPLFTKMYQDANGPKDHQLFDLNKDYSPFCFVFLIVHPKLLIATKENITKPYVVLLDVKVMYPTDQYPNMDTELKVVNVLTPEPLSVNEANHFLKYGYYDPVDFRDPRQGLGESLILYKVTEGQVSDIVKVNSTAFDFRLKMRNNDANLYHRFFELAHFVHSNSFESKFVPYLNYSKEQLEEYKRHQLLLWLDHGPCDSRKQLLLHQVWLNLLLSVPLQLQDEVLGFEEKYLKDREGVISWLVNYHLNNLNLDKSIVGERGVNIITTARNSVLNVKDVKIKHERIQKSIRGLIYKEYGSSLYTLVKLEKIK